jgi:hypothetical protein
MTPPYHQKEHVLQLIHEAFEEVKLEDGVSLHETIKIDNYGMTYAALEANIKADEREDWKKLVEDPEMFEVNGIGGLSFYDAKGLRFHLPAYLCLCIDQPDTEVASSLIFQLTHLEAYNRERFSILTTEQRKAVKVFLTYIRYNTGFTFEYDFNAIELAIQDYWSSLPT